ncbi:hypothetical protein DBR06_SOUSAS4910026, partial [Sousa chinensis]
MINPQRARRSPGPAALNPSPGIYSNTPHIQTTKHDISALQLILILSTSGRFTNTNTDRRTARGTPIHNYWTTCTHFILSFNPSVNTRTPTTSHIFHLHIYHRTRLTPNPSPHNMNPSTRTIPPHQHKPRGSIHTSNIKCSCILHSMIWPGLQLKLRVNWSPTSSGTNNLIRSSTSNHPPISTLNKRILHPVNPDHNTRTTMTRESELVSGFNVEYAADPFAIFFLAEYANIIIINIFTTILFLGAFHNPCTPELYTIHFIIKTLLPTTSFLCEGCEHPTL